MNPSLADLRAAVDGDAAARSRVLRAAAPTVLGWCRRLGGSAIDADDAAQDALRTALERLSTLRDPERFWGWIYGVTSKTVAWHRRRDPWRRWAAWVFEPASPMPSPAEDADRAASDRRVQTALDALPAALREAVVLCWVEERSTSEVAELLGVPQGTVKSRLRLARERLEPMFCPSEPVGSTPWTR